MSKTIVTNVSGLEKMVAEATGSAADAALIVGGNLMFQAGAKSGVEVVQVNCANPLGQMFLSFMGQLSALMSGNPFAMTLAKSMSAAAWDNMFRMANDAFAGGITADPMPGDAAKVQAFKTAQGEAGKDPRFSLSIGEGKGAGDLPKPKEPYTVWPTDLKQLQDKDGKPVCPCCGNRAKRSAFALGRVHENMTEVAACGSCRTNFANAQAKVKKEAEKAAAAIAQVKADEARFAELKQEITNLEAATSKAEIDATSVDAMLKANPDSTVAKAAKVAADAEIDKLNERYSALTAECKGLEAKLSGKPTAPVNVNKPTAGGPLDKLAQAEAKAKGKK